MEKSNLGEKIKSNNCPYEKLKSKLLDLFNLKEYIKNKLIQLIGDDNELYEEKITFKKGAKVLGLVNASSKIPHINSVIIEDFYNQVMSMNIEERKNYTKPFFTMEGYHSKEHLIYTQMQWLLMENIIHEIMDELIINNEGIYKLNIPEFSEDKWQEIGKNLELFEETLLHYFKIKINTKIISIKDLGLESDIYKLYEIVFNTNPKSFFDLFLDKGIKNSISNTSYLIEVAIKGIYEKDQVVSINKLENCIYNNSNSIIIDLSRSRTFLMELFNNYKNHFFYNSKKMKWNSIYY